jgi:hypothetical protein
MTAEPGSTTPLAEHDKPAGERAAQPTPDPAAAPDRPADEPPVRIRSEPAGGARTPAARTPVAPAPGAGLLALLAVGWLGVRLWGLQREIGMAPSEAVALGAAAISLPLVIAASLVAGAAAGLAAVNLVARRRPVARSAAALGAGVLVGVLAALGVVAGYSGTASGILAGTIAAAAVVGGAVAGIQAARVVAAVVAGALAVFAVIFVLNLVREPMLALFGSSGSAESIESARGWVALVVYVLSAVAAGLVPSHYLRRVSRRAGASPRWPAYMVAGAGVGIMLLVAEVITRVGGAQILDQVSSLSVTDLVLRRGDDAARLRYALVVLFAGALITTIAFGRTLPPKRRG